MSILYRMIKLVVVLGMLGYVASCAHPNYQYVPATLLFENGIIPRGIEEAPLIRLGQHMDAEWNKRVAYTAGRWGGLDLPALSVLNYRTVQIVASDSLEIMELRFVYTPDRVDPEDMVLEFENYLDQSADWENNSSPFRFHSYGPISLRYAEHTAMWMDDYTILQVLFGDMSNPVIVRIIDRAWNEERERLRQENSGGPRPRRQP